MEMKNKQSSLNFQDFIQGVHSKTYISKTAHYPISIMLLNVVFLYIYV